MEENKMKRTVKMKFLMADKVGKGVKSVAGYAVVLATTVGVAYIHEALSNHNDQEDNQNDET